MTALDVHGQVASTAELPTAMELDPRERSS
jgi:hypothetical protein